MKIKHASIYIRDFYFDKEAVVADDVNIEDGIVHFFFYAEDTYGQSRKREMVVPLSKVEHIWIL